MAADGSFPLEIARTEPYRYSPFNLDASAIVWPRSAGVCGVVAKTGPGSHLDEMIRNFVVRQPLLWIWRQLYR